MSGFRKLKKSGLICRFSGAGVPLASIPDHAQLHFVPFFLTRQHGILPRHLTRSYSFADSPRVNPSFQINHTLF